MPITKWFCIVLGSLMVIVAVAGAPIPEAIAVGPVFAARNTLDGLIKDGSISANADVALAKHASSGPDATEAVEMEVVRATSAAVARRTWFYGYLVFLMGCAWIAVGVRVGKLKQYGMGASFTRAPVQTPSDIHASQSCSSRPRGS